MKVLFYKFSLFLKSVCVFAQTVVCGNALILCQLTLCDVTIWHRKMLGINMRNFLRLCCDAKLCSFNAVFERMLLH